MVLVTGYFHPALYGFDNSPLGLRIHSCWHLSVKIDAFHEDGIFATFVSKRPPFRLFPFAGG